MRVAKKQSKLFEIRTECTTCRCQQVRLVVFTIFKFLTPQNQGKPPFWAVFSVFAPYLHLFISNPRGSTQLRLVIHDIKPHEIPLPPDSSDEDYDPDIYPKGTSLDIRRDEGDKDHIKSFVSYSDDEAEKEKKEKRSEYKFRRRVAKKRKSGKKPY